MKYSITTGDWSKDGHNQSDNFQLMTSHSRKDMVNAYRNFAKENKISFKKIFSEYEESAIDSEQIEILKNAGINFDNIGGWEEGVDGYYCFEPQGVVELLMEMIKTQIPEFTYQFEQTEEIEEFRGIGYGCYN
jgi:hypothetical protein